jgi:hypothetical protein
MNCDFLCDTIDFDRRDFSLVLVSPKKKFLEWLNAFVKQKGLEAYRLYIPEENTVLVIPNIDRFSEPGQLEEFLDVWKPKLLLAELSRFADAGPEDFGHAITKESFDEFLEIALRDSASIRFVTDFKKL